MCAKLLLLHLVYTLCFLNGEFEQDEFVFDIRQYKFDQFFDL